MTGNIATNSTVLVVGGGISGMTSALEAAECGKEVILVEKLPTLGGRTARLYRYFPKMCHPTCGLEINLRRLKANRKVRVITMAEVKAVEGSRAGPLVQRIDGRSIEIAAARQETRSLVHPPPDGLDPPVAARQLAEFLVGELLQLVRFAIAAGIEVGQDFRRQVGDGQFADVVGMVRVMGDVDRRLVIHEQRAGLAAQAQQPVAQERIGVGRARHRRADAHGFGPYRLARSRGGLDVENEIGGLIDNFITQANRKSETNHGFLKDIFMDTLARQLIVRVIPFKSKSWPARRMSMNL